jgi:hypothetical protein
MKITKQEVKTFYSIRIDFKDWTKAIENYKEKEAPKICYSKAFENFNIEDTTMGNLRNGFQNISFKGNADTFQYLATYFGFDGWQNAGFYSENRKAHCMVAYNYGDTANL